MLDFENHRQYPMMDSETGIISIDQGGEWDISLFDELDKLGDELGDADELLEALENAGYDNRGPDLDFDIDIPPWNEMDTSSISTDGEVSVDSLSPAHTLSSVPSPASVEALSPCSLQVRHKCQVFVLSGFLAFELHFQCKSHFVSGSEYLHVCPSFKQLQQ